MQGNPDLFANTEQGLSVAPQQLSASQTVNGTSIDLKDREHVVAELFLGTLAGAPTGGTVTLIPQEGNAANGSDAAQVNGSDQVVANFSDTFPEVLRYRYTGGVNGKLRYLRIKVVAALTGGSSPTIIVEGNILKGGLKYAGQQPTVGAYPQTPGSSITN